jgi:hypothetical protein
MKVVFLHGAPASGKWTIGKQLAELLKIPLFHNHLTVDLAATLFEFGSPSFIKLREQIWLAAFEAASDAGRSFIFTFTPEASVDPGMISTMQELVTKHGGKIFFVELQCAQTEIRRRLTEQSRAAFGKLRDFGLYSSISAAGGFKFPPLPPPLMVLHSDTMTAAAAAVAIETALLHAGH